MPITFDIDRSKDLTCFTLTGEVDLQAYLSALYRYSKEQPTKYELYDATGLEGQRLSSDDIETIAKNLLQYAEIRPAGSKTAVVVAADIDFGLMRMVALLTDQQVSYEIEVFRSNEQALAWLQDE